MKKNYLFALLCTCVLSFAACSCGDREINESAELFIEPYRVYTDYISDINDESGVVRHDYFMNYWYIDCANGNRYYVLGVDSLEKTGLLVDNNNVRFSGKVYNTDERWIDRQYEKLERYKNDSLYTFRLPGLDELATEGHTFWLVAPNFTITKAE